MKNNLLTLVFIFLSFFSHSQKINIKYKNYCNTRYKFCADYPVGILTPQGEPDLQDGQLFISKNKENELQVFRQFIDFGNDINELTIKYQFDKQILENKNQITYKNLGKDFFVI